jgi:ABC-type transporter Mla subunit MlaD
MADDTASELAGLRTAIDRLTQGLHQVAETQQTHTDMLAELLKAAALPTPQERELHDVLKVISATLTDHTGKLHAVLSVLQKLPSDVGSAVAASVGDALSKV